LCYSGLKNYGIAINHIQNERVNSAEHRTYKYLRNKFEELGAVKQTQKQQIHAGC
jgi:hypothetical protein